MTHGLIFLSIFLATAACVADVSVSCNCNGSTVIVAYVLKRAGRKVPVGRELFHLQFASFFPSLTLARRNVFLCVFVWAPVAFEACHKSGCPPHPLTHHPCLQPLTGVCVSSCMCGWNVPQAASFRKFSFLISARSANTKAQYIYTHISTRREAKPENTIYIYVYVYIAYIYSVQKPVLDRRSRSKSSAVAAFWTRWALALVCVCICVCFTAHMSRLSLPTSPSASPNWLLCRMWKDTLIRSEYPSILSPKKKEPQQLVEAFFISPTSTGDNSNLILDAQQM